MVRVDLRTITLNIPPKEVITKDNVPAKINAVAYFTIVEPRAAIVQIQNFHGRDLADRADDAALCARSACAEQLLSERDKSNAFLQKIIDDATAPVRDQGLDRRG